MDKITINTTQNVTIEYEIGSLGDRIIATLIDWLIIAGYCIFILIIIGNVSNHSHVGSTFVVLFMLFLLPALLYPLLCETFMNGQSFGKRARKIRVVRIDGRQASFGNYLMRWLIGLIEISSCDGVIAILAIVINGKGQRLGDLAAGTAVIKIRNKETISSTAFENLTDTYVPVFSQAANLTDDDANTIRQVLQLPPLQNAYTMQDRLARKLKEHLKIQSTLNNETFLKTILKDFNKINGRL